MPSHLYSLSKCSHHSSVASPRLLSVLHGEQGRFVGPETEVHRVYEKNPKPEGELAFVPYVPTYALTLPLQHSVIVQAQRL